MDIATATIAMAASITERAGELLEMGWAKGTLRRNSKDHGAPEFCILGALYAAGEELFGALKGNAYSADNEAVSLAQQFIVDEAYQVSSPRGSGSIPGWNDEQARTQEEVLAVMDKAAKRLWALSIEDNETGFSWEPAASGPVSEVEQKAYLTAALVMA